MYVLAVESIEIPTFLTFICGNNFDGDFPEGNLIRGDCEVGFEVFLLVGNEFLVIVRNLNLFTFNGFLLLFFVNNLNYLKLVTVVCLEVIIKEKKQVAAPLN